MRELPINITDSYLKPGNDPRVYVWFPDLDIFLGTAAATIDGESFENRLSQSGTISWDSPLLAGKATVSNVTISNIELGRSSGLSTNIEIEPKSESGIIGAGRVVREGLIGESYTDIRGASSGAFGTVSMIVGRWSFFLGGPESWGIGRSFIQVDIPSDLDSCEYSHISVDGLANNATTGFKLYLFAGDWPAWNTGNIFDAFDGHESGNTKYTGKILNEDWHSSEYSSTDTNEIRLNEHGRKLIEDNAGGTVRFAIISENDYNGSDASEPTNDEFLKFDSSSATLNLRYNTKNLTNAEAIILYAFEPVPDLTSDMFQVCTVIVNHWSLNNTLMTIDFTQDEHRQNITIPWEVITEDVFPDAPDINIGKPFPIVIGDVNPSTVGIHKAGVGLEKVGGVVDPTSGLHDYYDSPVVDNGDGDYNNPIQIIVANTDILDTLSARPAVWIQGLNAYGRLWAKISEDILRGTLYDPIKYLYVNAYPLARIRNNFTGAGFSIQEDFIGVAVSIIPSLVYDSNGVTDPENSYSESGIGSAQLETPSDYFYVGFTNRGSGGSIDSAEIVFELTDDGGAPALGVYLYEKPKAIDVSGTDAVSYQSIGIQYVSSAAVDFFAGGVQDGDMLIINDGETNEGRYRIDTVGFGGDDHILVMIDDMTDATAQGFKVIPSPSEVLVTNEQMTGDGQRILDITEFIDWNVDKILIKFTPIDVKTFNIANIQLRFFTSPDDNLTAVSFDKRGMKDDISGTITGTPGTLLEKPADVIQGIARQVVDNNESQIDTAAFDASAVILADWLMSFQIDDQKGALDLYGDICEQCKSIVMFDAFNRLTIKTYDENAGFPHASSTTPWVPENLDIFDEDAVEVNGAYTTHLIPGYVNIEPINQKEIKNDFKLYYNYNHQSEEYEKVIFITNGKGIVGNVETNINEAFLDNGQTLDDTGGLKDLVSNSYLKLGRTNRITINARSIRDDATAVKSLQYQIEQRTIERSIAEFVTMISAIGHERGDLINVRGARILDVMSSAQMKRQQWIIKRINLDTDNHVIKLRALEKVSHGQ